MSEISDNKWWPAEDVGSAFRSEEVAYAALGPVLTRRLLDEYDRLIAGDSSLDPEVHDFFEALRTCDGRRPEMLFLLAAAAIAVAESAGFLDHESPQAELLGNDSLKSDTYKFLGSFVVEAIRTFGFTEETFLEYVSRDHSHFGEGIWPPPGAAYTRRPPARVEPPLGKSLDENESDPLAFWQSLRDYPSLIGAHLVELDDLYRYESALREALDNVDRDLNDANIADSEAARAELERAVEMVSKANRMIAEAQELIVGRFST